MPTKTLILVIILGFFCQISAGQQHHNLGEKYWKRYELNSFVFKGETGFLTLFVDPIDGINNKLNRLILKNSSFIPAVLDSYKLSADADLKKIFVKESPPRNDNDEIFQNISTKTFFISPNILSYKIRYDVKNDKGSPYFDFINIDLVKEDTLNKESLIDKGKINSFAVFLQRYASRHKKVLLKNYKALFSERADQLIVSQYEVFDSKAYSLNKVFIQRPTISSALQCFEPRGIRLNFIVKDKNFNNGDGEPNEYESYLIMPNRYLKLFLNKKSPVSAALSR